MIFYRIVFFHLNEIILLFQREYYKGHIVLHDNNFNYHTLSVFSILFGAMVKSLNTGLLKKKKKPFGLFKCRLGQFFDTLPSLSRTCCAKAARKKNSIPMRKKGTILSYCMPSMRLLENDQEPSLLCPGQNPGSTLQLRHRPMTQLDYTGRRESSRMQLQYSVCTSISPFSLIISFESTMPKSVSMIA